MKKRLSAIALIIAVIMLLPGAAAADIGPKPSVRITFTGSDGSTYYGTLLSKHESTGPSSVWNGDEAYARYDHDGGREIWQAFVEYEDVDGFYFLQEWWDCTESNRLNWTYYPPSTFKILLYFPDSGEFSVSPVYERYAFDSYYTVDVSSRSGDGLIAAKSYEYAWELVSLALRVMITITAELSMALLFGYQQRREIRFLAVVNIITQVILNAGLNVVNYYRGELAFILCLIAFELLVFAIEAYIYAKSLHRFSDKPKSKGRAVLYALAANAGSLLLGLWLAELIPDIF